MTVYEKAIKKMDRFGKNLRSVRESKHITQSGLARMTGMTNTTISRAETQKVMPSAYNMILMSEALGVTLDELLKEK